jgi:hypothetical protein
LTSRPELVAGCAEIARSEADVEVMRDMFHPVGASVYANGIDA